MASVLPQFGSFSMDSSTGVALEDIQDMLLIDSDYERRINTDGSILTKYDLEGREITLKGTIGSQTSADDARTKIQTFIAALRNGKQNLQIFDDRHIPCRLDGPLTYKNVRAGALVVWTWKARFRSEEPYWQKTTDTTSVVVKSGASPYTHTYPANNGTAPALPIIVLTLNSSSVTNKTISLINDSTGAEIRLHAFDWNIDDDITFDFEARTISDPDGNPIFAGTIEGDWWDIPGDGGVTTLRIKHDIGSGLNIDIDTTWTERFESL